MQVEVTDAEIEAVTDPDVIALADEIVFNNHGAGNASVLIDRFAARHRIAERERVVGEIVAEARGETGSAWSRDVLQFADWIEAKFGGRDAD